jgi:hypothetical protein
MPDDLSADSEYGPGKFRALFERGLDFAIDRMLRRAEAQGGSVSADDLRDELAQFKRNPDADTAEFFEDAWRECTFAVERLRWDQERRYPFERLMVNTFVHLLPTGDQVPIQGEHLSRRIIPGFVSAMLQMLGEELSDKYEDFCRTMVSRLKAQHDNAFNWDMGAPTAAQDVPFEEMECHRLISAMYQPLRDAMNTPEGESRITERYGRDRARMLRAVFAEITRDHRELSLGLSSQPTTA